MGATRPVRRKTDGPRQLVRTQRAMMLPYQLRSVETQRESPLKSVMMGWGPGTKDASLDARLVPTMDGTALVVILRLLIVVQNNAGTIS